MSEDIFKNPSNLFEKRISEMFAAQPSSEFDSILRLVSMIILESAPSDDMIALYKLLPLEQFVRVINLFDGRNIKFFSAKEIQDALVLALCFYYKEVQRLDWKDISDKMPLAISSISYGSKIKKLSKMVQMQMQSILGERT